MNYIVCRRRQRAVQSRPIGSRRTASLVGLNETTAPAARSGATAGRLSTGRDKCAGQDNSATCLSKTTEGAALPRAASIMVKSVSADQDIALTGRAIKDLRV